MATVVVTGTVDGSNAVFTLATAIANPNVYVDRLHQRPTDFSIVGTTLTFLTDIPQPAVPGTPDLASAHIDVYGDLLGVVGSGGFTASKTNFATAGTIINRAAVQIGLASVSDPFASTDPNFIQLAEFMNFVGESLRHKHEWAHTMREATITTAGAATSYAMPTDFLRMSDQTQWNRSTRFAMLGPLSGQEVQYLKARLAGVLVQVAYRLQANMMTFAIAPPDGQTLAFEYQSAYWVWSAAGTAPDSLSAVATGDTVLFDRDLMIAGTKLYFLEAKGFDTVAAQARFDTLLEQSIANNVGSKMLNVGGIGINADHLIDSANLPITGYGQ